MLNTQNFGMKYKNEPNLKWSNNIKEDGNPQYIIGEAKYGSSQLRNTADGKQMSNDWIYNRLDNTTLSQTIKDEMILNPDNVGTNLYHISHSGEVDVSPLNNGEKIH